MRIEILHSNIPVSEALVAHIESKIGYALRRFRDRVGRAGVRLVDQNGPRGGNDTRCRIVVELVAGRRIFAQAIAVDAYAAVADAAARLDGRVTREIARRKPANRELAPPPEAAAPAGRPIVTQTDMDVLWSLLASVPARDRAAAEALESELQRARVVPPAELPESVVSLNARVLFRDEESGDEREVTLVLPHEADGARNRVSVLAPVGAALLGLSVGESIEWPFPRGARRLRIVSVPR